LFLLGNTKGHLGQSLYLREIMGQEAGPPPPVDLAVERRHGDMVRALIGAGTVSAVHDLSDGGLGVALLDMLMAGQIGATVTSEVSARNAGFWFGEDQGRYLLATSDPDALKATLGDLPLLKIADVFGDQLVIGDQKIAISEFKSIHENWLPNYMNGA
jgi:phosphoribosylformylglycinamidine synthase subunit PurL